MKMLSKSGKQCTKRISTKRYCKNVPSENHRAKQYNNWKIQWKDSTERRLDEVKTQNLQDRRVELILFGWSKREKNKEGKDSFRDYVT